LGEILHVLKISVLTLKVGVCFCKASSSKECEQIDGDLQGRSVENLEEKNGMESVEVDCVAIGCVDEVL
jgi:hypothetical protein